jgi:DNA-binding transcriptional ArsR family regulator
MRATEHKTSRSRRERIPGRQFDDCIPEDGWLLVLPATKIGGRLDRRSSTEHRRPTARAKQELVTRDLKAIVHLKAWRQRYDGEELLHRVFASQATLHKLEVFCMVCELESVTRVADRMRVAPPVVTAHLRFLEKKPGVRLFERSGRRLMLTVAGRRVNKWASDVITRSRELERELDLAIDGELASAVVAASMTVASYVFPPTRARG